MVKKTMVWLAFVVWPIVVDAAFEGLSHMTSSYYTFRGLFAFAALCHIPIFFGWVFNRFAAGTRWPVIFVFVVVQAMIVPSLLKAILVG